MLLILLTASLAVGQTDSWEQAFNSVPESVRPRLVERFHLMAEYERGRMEPSLLFLLAVVRLAEIPSLLEVLVDDELELPRRMPASARSKRGLLHK